MSLDLVANIVNRFRRDGCVFHVFASLLEKPNLILDPTGGSEKS